MLYPNGLRVRPTVTSPYGWRTHPIRKTRSFHYGNDSINHPGGWNRAPEAGVVVFARYNGGNGNEVRILGDSGRLWKILHHARIDVAEGQRVPLGHVTGPTGTTGASTGVHCHLECWESGASIDSYAIITANLSGSGGSGGGASTSPNRKKNDMTALHFRTGDSAQALGYNFHILVLETGVRVTYTTGEQSFVDDISAQLGAPPRTTDGAFIAALQSQIKSQLPKLVIDATGIKVTPDNKAVVDALQKLGVDLTKAIVVDAPKAIDEYNDGKKNS